MWDSTSDRSLQVGGWKALVGKGCMMPRTLLLLRRRSVGPLGAVRAASRSARDACDGRPLPPTISLSLALADDSPPCSLRRCPCERRSKRWRWARGSLLAGWRTLMRFRVEARRSAASNSGSSASMTTDASVRQQKMLCMEWKSTFTRWGTCDGCHSRSHSGSTVRAMSTGGVCAGTLHVAVAAAAKARWQGLKLTYFKANAEWLDEQARAA